MEPADRKMELDYFSFWIAFLVCLFLVASVCFIAHADDCPKTGYVTDYKLFDDTELDESIKFSLKENGIWYIRNDPHGKLVGYAVEYKVLGVITGIRCPDNVRAYYEQ